MEAYQPQYQGSPNPVALVGVHLVKKGLSGAIACDLKRISRKRAQFRALTAAYKADYGVDFELTASATGKEPCVLAKFDDGSTAMLLDARDLALVDGNVKKFDQNLRAKMMFFF
ncbi:hypothetical protein [Rhodoluna lacicola]|uniref:hypothetical protein n=1 Tax=Rhodoluna lacicola TaxID=529884 RepID=UPI00222F53AF|nr:hypothetical protein [Rhodoluna lacicola]BDS50951.1 hypothetical protein RKACHI23_12130 [Rhodoluna lacicola]